MKNALRNFAQIGRLVRTPGLALALAMTLFTPGQAQAQSNRAPAQSNAVIVAPFSFFKVEDLVFGRIIPGSTAGSVKVASNGVRTKTGGVILAGGTTPQPARFAGRGTANQIVAMLVASNSVPLNRVGGGDSMSMDSFEIGSNPTVNLSTTPLFGIIGTPDGSFMFPVGATLRVKANQAPGSYVGTFTVILAYQ